MGFMTVECLNGPGNRGLNPPILAPLTAHESAAVPD